MLPTGDHILVTHGQHRWCIIPQTVNTV